jgi:hypothetical protein
LLHIVTCINVDVFSALFSFQRTTFLIRLISDK